MASKLKLQIAPEKRPGTWEPEQALADALAERALFLETHPQYKSFQNEINKMLEKAGSPENRMTVLAVLMEAKLLELQKELRRLNSTLISMTDQRRPERRTNQLIPLK